MAETNILPTDQFDKLLSRLIGLPNGAHTQPTVVQAVDFYGNTTSYMVQTARTEEGPTVFLTQVNATTQIRRRHGKRLAEERGGTFGGFTPEMRAKGLETRRRKAAAKARKAAR